MTPNHAMQPSAVGELVVVRRLRRTLQNTNGNTYPNMNPSSEKQLYQAAFAGSLGYLFIALVFLRGPTNPFGFVQTTLAVVACVLTWRALAAAKMRAESGPKNEDAPASLAGRLSDLEEARK